MAIPLKHEGSEDAGPYIKVIERCHFCGVGTRWWHENTNNPVCPVCAKFHKVSELPDFGQNIRAMKRKARKTAPGGKDD